MHFIIKKLRNTSTARLDIIICKICKMTFNFSKRCPAGGHDLNVDTFNTVRWKLSTAWFQHLSKNVTDFSAGVFSQLCNSIWLLLLANQRFRGVYRATSCHLFHLQVHQLRRSVTVVHWSATTVTSQWYGDMIKKYLTHEHSSVPFRRAILVPTRQNYDSQFQLQRKPASTFRNRIISRNDISCTHWTPDLIICDYALWLYLRHKVYARHRPLP